MTLLYLLVCFSSLGGSGLPCLQEELLDFRFVQLFNSLGVVTSKLLTRGTVSPPDSFLHDIEVFNSFSTKFPIFILKRRLVTWTVFEMGVISFNILYKAQERS